MRQQYKNLQVTDDQVKKYSFQLNYKIPPKVFHSNAIFSNKSTYEPVCEQQVIEYQNSSNPKLLCMRKQIIEEHSAYSLRQTNSLPTCNHDHKTEFSLCVLLLVLFLSVALNHLLAVNNCIRNCSNFQIQSSEYKKTLFTCSCISNQNLGIKIGFS